MRNFRAVSEATTETLKSCSLMNQTTRQSQAMMFVAVEMYVKQPVCQYFGTLVPRARLESIPRCGRDSALAASGKQLPLACMT